MNARFWIFTNNGHVKLTLRPDQMLTHHKHSHHDEGVSWSVEQYYYDGEFVSCKWADGGTDCDGRHRREGAEYCRRDKLMAETDDSGVKRPSWTRGKVVVTDEFAQAMGY